MTSWRADLVSPVFERWRFADAALPGSYELRVYDEGEELTVTTDYADEGDGVLALVAEAGEPITVELEGDSGDGFIRDLGGLDRLIENLAVDRGPLTLADIDHRRLCSLHANRALMWTRRRPAQELLGDLLGGVLGFAFIANDGTLTFDALLPPTAPGPRGGSCVEIASAVDQASGVDWDTGTTMITGWDFSLGVWVKLFRTGPNDTAFGDVLIARLYDDAHVHEIRLNLDADQGVPQLELEFYDSGIRTEQRRVGVTIPSAGVGAPVWWWIGVTNDTSTNQCIFYGAQLGDSTLSFLGSAAAIDPVTATSEWNGLQVGGDMSPYDVYFPWFRGGVAEPQLWSSVLNFTAMENLYKDAVGSTASRVFFAPLDGLSATALTDVETATVGTVTGFVRERPDLVVDLTVTPRPLRRRKVVPAKSIEVHYGRNYDPLRSEEFAAAVSSAERQRLAREWRTIPYRSAAVADDYKDARDVPIFAPWMTRNGALATFRLARFWYRPDREVAVLGPTPDAPLREGLMLEPGDEVQLIGYQELADGPVYRVEGSRRSLDTLDCQVSMRR